MASSGDRSSFDRERACRVFGRMEVAEEDIQVEVGWQGWPGLSFCNERANQYGTDMLLLP